MFGVTVAQAQNRLPVERNRSNRLTQSISGLEGALRRLTNHLEGIQTRTTAFLGNEVSVTNRDWQGETMKKFAGDVAGMEHFTGDYMRRLGSSVTSIREEIQRRNTELRNVNGIVSELERVIATGGVV